MASRRTSRKQEVSLFPFLDILACVIGNLILIITTVVLEQVDTKPVAEAAHLEEALLQAEKDAAEARRLRQQLADLRNRQDSHDSRLRDAHQAIAEAERKRKEAAARLAALPPPPRADETLAVERKRLDEDRRKTDEELRKMEADIAAAKKKSEQSIMILPAGSGGEGRPSRGVFVEVNADGLVILSDGQAWQVPVNGLASDERFRTVIEAVRADEQSIVTFLVRSDGVGVLRQAQNFLKAAGVRFGKVPLPGKGNLDLSRMQ